MNWTIQDLNHSKGNGFIITSNHSDGLWGPPSLPIQWALGALNLGTKWPGPGAYHSRPFRAEVKNEFSYTATPCICLSGVYSNNLTFTSIFFGGEVLFLTETSHYHLASDFLKVQAFGQNHD